MHTHGMWVRILKTGTKVGHHDRIRANMKSKNIHPAPLSILRTDHRPFDDQSIAPPGDPACGEDVLYNKGLSHLISMILQDIYIDEKIVCSSTDKLLAELDKVNEKGVKGTYIVGSMNVEALYPSLDIDFTV